MNKAERLQAAAIAAPGIRDTRPARKVHVWNPETGQVVGTLNSREVARKVAERVKIELGSEGLKSVGECGSCGAPVFKKINCFQLCTSCAKNRQCSGRNDSISWVCTNKVKVKNNGRPAGRFCPNCTQRRYFDKPLGPRVGKCKLCQVSIAQPYYGNKVYCDSCLSKRPCQARRGKWKCERFAEIGMTLCGGCRQRKKKGKLFGPLRRLRPPGTARVCLHCPNPSLPTRVLCRDHYNEKAVKRIREGKKANQALPCTKCNRKRHLAYSMCRVHHSEQKRDYYIRNRERLIRKSNARYHSKKCTPVTHSKNA